MASPRRNTWRGGIAGGRSPRSSHCCSRVTLEHVCISALALDESKLFGVDVRKGVVASDVLAEPKLRVVRAIKRRKSSLVKITGRIPSCTCRRTPCCCDGLVEGSIGVLFGWQKIGTVLALGLRVAVQDLEQACSQESTWSSRSRAAPGT